jgi:maltose O-acetyltransferase
MAKTTEISTRTMLGQYIGHPVAFLLALIRFLRMKRRCLSFGGFAGNNILYANGVRITNYHKVKIGKGVSFGGNVQLLAHDTIEIGDGCTFAYGTIIETATHDYRSENMGETFVTKPVRIGSNVWFGLNCCVLPGVTIGSGAVIGACALVTRDVPPQAIVAGVPARILKYRFDK